MKHVFGPVPSRRLGMSLGLDIVPFKTCTLDCVYCQLGRTTVKTIERSPFVSKDELISELKVALNKRDQIDYITFSGSGEPTLNSEIGKMIDEIKLITDIPVAVLTNGTLLHLQEVRRDIEKADLVVPSLDSVTSTFYEVNRPVQALDVELIIEGLRKFCEEYKGKIWLEIMLVRGINDDLPGIMQLSDVVTKLKVNKIHLNTVVRPPAEDFARPLSEEEMKSILKFFDERAEIIADFDKLTLSGSHVPETIEEEIVSVVRRRPCTANDISSSLNIHLNEAIKHITRLVDDGRLKPVTQGGKIYYTAV